MNALVNVNDYLGPERMQELFREYADGIEILCLAPLNDIPLPQLSHYKITYNGREMRFKTCTPYEELFDVENARFIIKSFKAAELEKERV